MSILTIDVLSSVFVFFFCLTEFSIPEFVPLCKFSWSFWFGYLVGYWYSYFVDFSILKSLIISMNYNLLIRNHIQLDDNMRFARSEFKKKIYCT